MLVMRIIFSSLKSHSATVSINLFQPPYLPLIMSYFSHGSQILIKCSTAEKKL